MAVSATTAFYLLKLKPWAHTVVFRTRRQDSESVMLTILDELLTGGEGEVKLPAQLTILWAATGHHALFTPNHIAPTNRHLWDLAVLATWKGNERDVVHSVEELGTHASFETFWMVVSPRPLPPPPVPQQQRRFLPPVMPGMHWPSLLRPAELWAVFSSSAKALLSFWSKPLARGPFHMLNLVKFKGSNVGGTAESDGRTLYQQYTVEASKLVAMVGGRVVWMAGIRFDSDGDIERELWDEAFVIEYPGKASFLRMVSSAEYQAIVGLRKRALEDSMLFATLPLVEWRPQAGNMAGSEDNGIGTHSVAPSAGMGRL